MTLFARTLIPPFGSHPPPNYATPGKSRKKSRYSRPVNRTENGLYVTKFCHTVDP